MFLQGHQVRGGRILVAPSDLIGTAQRQQVGDVFRADAGQETTYRRIAPGLVVVEHVVPDQVGRTDHLGVGEAQAAHDPLRDLGGEALVSVKAKAATCLALEGRRLADVVQKRRQPDRQ